MDWRFGLSFSIWMRNDVYSFWISTSSNHEPPEKKRHPCLCFCYPVPPDKNTQCLSVEGTNARPASLGFVVDSTLFWHSRWKRTPSKKKNPDSIGDVQLSSWMSEPQKNDDVFSKDIPQEKGGIFNKKFLCKTWKNAGKSMNFLQSFRHPKNMKNP